MIVAYADVLARLDRLPSEAQAVVRLEPLATRMRLAHDTRSLHQTMRSWRSSTVYHAASMKTSCMDFE